MKGENMLKKTNDTKIIILGGLGEIGKNMYCVMHGDEIIIIDSGISFPEDSLLGIDYVLPDVTFLKQNQDKIKALIITHGHEDHIGGIPYLVQTLNIPAIYAPNQAKELIALKLQDKNIRYDNLFVYNDQTVLKFKKLRWNFLEQLTLYQILMEFLLRLQMVTLLQLVTLNLTLLQLDQWQIYTKWQELVKKVLTF